MILSKNSFVLLFVFLFGIAVVSSSPPQPISVKGHVYHNNGTPINSGKTIYIKNLDTGSEKETITGYFPSQPPNYFNIAMDKATVGDKLKIYIKTNGDISHTIVNAEIETNVSLTKGMKIDSFNENSEYEKSSENSENFYGSSEEKNKDSGLNEYDGSSEFKEKENQDNSSYDYENNPLFWFISSIILVSLAVIFLKSKLLRKNENEDD